MSADARRAEPRPRRGGFAASVERFVLKARTADLTGAIDRRALRAELVHLVEQIDALDGEEESSKCSS